MSAKPWEKWTPGEINSCAAFAWREGFGAIADMLQSFAAMKEAEREGKRCVLPSNACVYWQQAIGYWRAELSGDVVHFEGAGATQQAAIEDLAAKLRGEG